MNGTALAQGEGDDGDRIVELDEYDDTPIRDEHTCDRCGRKANLLQQVLIGGHFENKGDGSLRRAKDYEAWCLECAE